MDFVAIIFFAVIALFILFAVFLIVLMILASKNAQNRLKNASPEEKSLLDMTVYYPQKVTNAPEFVAMSGVFPRSVTGEKTVGTYGAIITQNFVKLMDPPLNPIYTRGTVFEFNVKQVVIDKVHHSQASVAKRAAAGAVVAGGAGAVVGALSAADKNQKGGVAHHSLESTAHYVIALMCPEGRTVTFGDGLLLNNELLKKFKASPEMMKCNREINGNYIKMPGSYSNFATKEEATKIAAWLNKNVFGKKQ